MMLFVLPLCAHALVVPTPMARAVRTPVQTPARAQILLAAEDRDVSDAETVFRWIGVQGSIDLTILLGFAYDLRRKLGDTDVPFEDFVKLAIASPGLKYLILMPALTVFFQILRRFGAEDGILTRGGTFEEDPIVLFLGGATKVRSIRNRWVEMTTIKAK